MFKSSEFLGRIHSDLEGPFPRTRQGYWYYISFLEKNTGLLDVKPLKFKDNALTALKNYKALQEKQSGRQLKVLHTDKRGEYMGEFDDYLKEIDIIHKITAPYLPEQNRKAERVYRTIMGPVRAILAQQKLPKSLWAEIAKAVVYLRNRSPISQGTTTAYENLKSEKPYLGHLRILGCRVWVHIPKEKRKKLDDRSYQGIHVGYEGTNQYRVYDPHSGRVSVTRDVHFDEAHRYDKKDLKPQDFADDEWHKEDDELFADPTDIIDASEPFSEFSTIPQRSSETNPYFDNSRNSSPLSDIPDSVGDEEHYEEDDATPEDQLRRETEEWSRLQLNRGDRDSGIQPSDATPKRSRQDRLAEPTPGTRQSARIKEKTPTSANVMRSISATSSIPKSHIHMVTVLANLNAGYDNSGPDKPLTIKEAMATPYWKDFEKAMHIEFQSLIENDTWEYRDAPSGRAVLTGRWVFKIKKDRWGKILKFKARWVAHGYKQQEGLDYTETFASVIKPMSWKSMMGMSAKRGYRIRQMDVITAFLYGFLDEEIYIMQPTMFEDGTTRVCFLKKALYGLKQAPRVWYQTLLDFLRKLDFHKTEADHGLFVSADKTMFIAVYVDDLLLFGADIDPRIDDVMQNLRDRFRMTDLGDVSHYLGMEVDVDLNKKTITLRQSTYLKKILGRYGMSDCRPAKIPISPGVANSLTVYEDKAEKSIVALYQSAVRALMWPAMHSRLDLAYSVGVLSRFCSNPRLIHVELVKRVLRYVSGTLHLGLTYDREADTPDDVIGYTDSDFAGSKPDQKSTGGYVFMLAGATISYSSKLQSIVALSTCEAEYVAMCEARKEAVWLGYLLAELGFWKRSTPVILYADNQGSIALLNNPEFHRRTKHIDVRFHWICEAVSIKQLNIVFILTAEIAADGLTKGLSTPGFSDFCRMIGMSTGL